MLSVNNQLKSCVKTVRESVLLLLSIANIYREVQGET